VSESLRIILRLTHGEVNVAQPGEQHIRVLVRTQVFGALGRVAVDAPLEKVVDVVADDEGVVLARHPYEGFTTAQGHCLAGWVGACRYDVDDVAVMLAILSWVAESRLSCMLVQVSTSS
jgi:hypothetical protein